MAYFIQRKSQGWLETVDQAETVKEAADLLREYQQADRSAFYYPSRRPCRSWQSQG